MSAAAPETRDAATSETVRGLLPDVNRTTRSHSRATLKLATCLVVGMLGVLYAYGLRTFMS